MGTHRAVLPLCNRQSVKEAREGVKIPTRLRGFAYSTREAVTALRLMFGNSDFFYREAVNNCNIPAKEFAKLRTDGVIIKVDKHWPSRWRLAQRYLSDVDLHSPSDGYEGVSNG